MERDQRTRRTVSSDYDDDRTSETGAVTVSFGAERGPSKTLEVVADDRQCRCFLPESTSPSGEPRVHVIELGRSISG